jgi:hypothetical protein
MMASIYPGGFAPGSLFAEEFLTRYGTIRDHNRIKQHGDESRYWRIAYDIVDLHRLEMALTIKSLALPTCKDVFTSLFRKDAPSCVMLRRK